LTQDRNFYLHPQKKEQEGLPRKKLHLLSCECASKEKKENPRSMIGGKQKEKKKKIPDQRLEESKRKRKIPDQRSEERKIYKKVVRPENV